MDRVAVRVGRAAHLQAHQTGVAVDQVNQERAEVVQVS